MPQVEAAGPALTAGPAELLDAAQGVEGVVSQVFAAAHGLQRTVGGLRAAASDLRDLLPHAGGRQAELGAAMREALQRVDAVPAGTWAVMAQGQPSAPELEAALTAADLVTDLETAIGRVTDAASEVARQRADVLLPLAEQVRPLVPDTELPDVRGGRLRTAERTVSDLLVEPAQPQAAAEATEVARHLAGAVSDLQEAIEIVLTEATAGLRDRVAAARAVFAGMGTDLPITAEQRAALTLLDDSLLNEGGVLAASPETGAAVAVVRLGLIALTALETAASDALDPVPLTDRGQAALDLATAARKLLGQVDQRNALRLAIRTVWSALGNLAQREQPGTEAEARESGQRISAVTARVTRLETVTRQVIAAATAQVDGLRSEAEAAHLVARAARGQLQQPGRPDRPPGPGGRTAAGGDAQLVAGGRGGSSDSGAAGGGRSGPARRGGAGPAGDPGGRRSRGRRAGRRERGLAGTGSCRHRRGRDGPGSAAVHRPTGG